MPRRAEGIAKIYQQSLGGRGPRRHPSRRCARADRLGAHGRRRDRRGEGGGIEGADHRHLATRPLAPAAPLRPPPAGRTFRRGGVPDRAIRAPSSAPRGGALQARRGRLAAGRRRVASLDPGDLARVQPRRETAVHPPPGLAMGRPSPSGRPGDRPDPRRRPPRGTAHRDRRTRAVVVGVRRRCRGHPRPSRSFGERDSLRATDHKLHRPIAEPPARRLDAPGCAPGTRPGPSRSVVARPGGGGIWRPHRRGRLRLRAHLRARPDPQGAALGDDGGPRAPGPGARPRASPDRTRFVVARGGLHRVDASTPLGKSA